MSFAEKTQGNIKPDKCAATKLFKVYGLYTVAKCLALPTPSSGVRWPLMRLQITATDNTLWLHIDSSDNYGLFQHVPRSSQCKSQQRVFMEGSMHRARQAEEFQGARTMALSQCRKCAFVGKHVLVEL